MGRKGKPDLLQELLAAVAERVEPRCRHFGTCGGCDLQHVPYETQARLKHGLIETALAAEGVQAEVAPTAPALDPWQYRNKIEASFAAADGQLILGFGPKDRWYDRLDLQECPIAPEWMAQAVEIARRWARENGVPAYDQRTRQGFLRYLALREGRTTGQRIVNLVTNADEGIAPYPTLPHEGGRREGAQAGQAREWDLAGFVRAMEPMQPSAVVRTLHTGPSSAVRFERVDVLAGEPHFSEQVAGLNLALSLDSFFQTNTLMAERMYEHVRGLARGVPGDDAARRVPGRSKPPSPEASELWRLLPHAEIPPPYPPAVAKAMAGKPPQRGEETARIGHVLDLYCGVGSIGLLLAREAESVLGVEEVAPAIERAKENAAFNGIGNAEFVCARAEKFAIEPGRWDLVVLDPPRAGCSKRVLRHLAEAGVPRMIYVSCSPAALARDLAYLKEWYAFGSVQPFDLFPQTRHVEAVVEVKRQ